MRDDATDDEFFLSQHYVTKVKCGADKKETARNNRAMHKQRKAGRRHGTL